LARSRNFRRLRMGLSTLLGGRAQGWFIPYRYADTLAPPVGYPAIEKLFDAARYNFSAFLATIDEYAEVLEAIGGEPAPHPRWQQGWFPRLDGAATYTMVRDRAPGRVVEIGSGHSTRFIARAVADGGLSTKIIAIDPAPRANIAEIGVEHIAATVHDAGSVPFDGLESGDILFVDSSHILMPGTDVDYLFNTLWPALPAGMIVHVHDMLLPDGYPDSWAWRGYNEQSLVAGLLSSGAAKPLFASHYATTRMEEEIASGVIGRLPLFDGAFETSLWLQKAVEKM